VPLKASEDPFAVDVADAQEKKEGAKEGDQGEVQTDRHRVPSLASMGSSKGTERAAAARRSGFFNQKYIDNLIFLNYLTAYKE
jgi:hypothetical protein